MNSQLRNELAEIIILSLISDAPADGHGLILELNKWIELGAVVKEWSFSDLCKNGYCDLCFEEKNGNAYGVFSITQKGEQRLSDFLDMKNLIYRIYELL